MWMSYRPGPDATRAVRRRGRTGCVGLGLGSERVRKFRVAIFKNLDVFLCFRQG